MASVYPKEKNGKIVGYKFRALLGREDGKQVFQCMTWTPPDGMTPAKMRKAAERAADDWEQQVREEYQKKQEAAKQGLYAAIPADQRKDDFADFIDEMWLPLQVRGGECKPTTIDYYERAARTIKAYFNGCILQEISSLQLQRFIVYLRKEYRTSR